jgi:hypothetical protein
MWAMKNKGDKPHYKPGTDKKYKKYQEEETSPMPNVSSKDRGAIKKRAKNLFKRDLKGDHLSVNEEIISEKDLNAAERRALPNKDFALPGKGEGPQGKQAGSYPIPDEKHARSALSLVSQHGTPEEKSKVRAKVKKKFPGIQVNEADDQAFKNVVGMLQKKYGKDSVLTKDNPPKKPTEAQKKSYSDHRAKLAKQDRRDDLEKSSQGRYSRKYSNAGSD